MINRHQFERLLAFRATKMINLNQIKITLGFNLAVRAWNGNLC